MAFSSETGGYAFNPVLAKIDEYQSLAGLKPLSFSGGGQSAVQFKPLAGWSVPSSHPEYIAQGISSGLGSIAQGIEAAYKSKEAKAEKQKDREYELQKYESQRKTKLEDEETFARFRASLPSRYPKRSEAIPPDYDSEETGNYGTSVMSSATPPASSEAPAPKAERYKRDLSPIKGGSFNEINLPEEDENSVPARLRNLKNSLGDITSPVPISEAPSPRGQDAINALSTIDWSKVQGSLGAGTGAGASPVDIPAQSPDWLRKPKAVTAPLSTLGGVSDESLPNVEQALADAQTAYASGTIQPSESLKSAGGVPKAAFRSYSEAQRYIDSQSDNPNWYAEGAPKPDKFGNFVIPWKHHDPAKLAQNDATRQMAKDRLSRLDQAGLATEVDKFNKDPIYKIMQARPMQIAEFQSAMDEAFDPETKKSRRAVDLDAIDKFVMFARGTQPTEAQYSEIQNWTQGYLQDVKQKIEKGVEGARLSDNDYNTMMGLMYRAYNTTANLVNPEIEDLRDVVKTKHPSLLEKELPQSYIPYEVPSFFKEKVADAQDEMRQAHAAMTLAKQKNDKELFAQAKSQYDDAVKMQNKYLIDLEKSKASKKPLNMKKFKRGGWKQGLFGGVSDIGGAGNIQEQ
jgi:hypothetical protein